jgi:hypothetical protein
MNLWEWLWQWTNDSVAVNWFRTLAAAVIGGVFGGMFTLIGQARQARSDRQAQKLQLAAELEAAESRWAREKRAAARAESVKTARSLFDTFVKLADDIRFPAGQWQFQTDADWAVEIWPIIWPDSLRTEIDIQSRLLVDDDANARESIRAIVRLLLQAETVSAGAVWNTRRTSHSLRSLAASLADEGIAIMGAYLRDEPFVSERAALLQELESAWSSYREFEQSEIARLSGLAGVGASQKGPKFVIRKDKKGDLRFVLKASNGEIIAVSEGYATPEGVLAGIEAVRVNAADSTVVDET